MTFTVLARDDARGRIGAATASRSLAVGASVIAVDPAVGAVASQAWTNRSLRALLLDDLRAGAPAEAAVRRVPEWDAGAQLRQVAALGWNGAGAARSGTDISAWAGFRLTPDAVFVGNLLTGAGVIHAMATAWAETSGADLDDRLIAVLHAGEDAGGDARGRQSAALLVASHQELLLDLRVDDHSDPVAELERLRRLAAAPAEVALVHERGACPSP